MLIDSILKKVEQMWIFLNVSFPFWTFKLFSQWYEIAEKYLTEILTHLILNPHWDKT